MSDTPSAPAVSPSLSTQLRARTGAFLRRYQGVLGLVVLILLASCPIGFEAGGVRFSLYSPYFRSWDNFANIFRQTSITGILAVGMTFVIISGGIELSVGSGLAFLSCIAAMIAIRPNASVALVVLVVLACGGVVGTVNGALVAKGRFQPFIATLAGMVTLRGLAYRVSHAAIITGPTLDAKFQFFSGNIGIPIPSFLWGILGTNQRMNPVPFFALFFLAAVVLGQVLLLRTRFGRHAITVGGNEEAARLSGIAVDRDKILVYALNGLLVGLAALMYTARTSSGDPGSGIGYELDAIAAVVVGGTPLTGGRGSIVGTLVGALFIGTLNNVLQLNNIDRFTALALEGPIILMAVALQRGRR